MYAKGIAILAITRHGVETALEIKDALDAAGLNSIVYAPKKYNQNGVVAIDKKVSEFIEDTYSTVEHASASKGIAIRA